MSTIKADNIATLAGVSTSMANAVNGSAKAWVNFNGSGTVAIRGSYNVSSITDNGTGNYTVNFATAKVTTQLTLQLLWWMLIMELRALVTSFLENTQETFKFQEHQRQAQSEL